MSKNGRSRKANKNSRGGTQPNPNPGYGTSLVPNGGTIRAFTFHTGEGTSIEIELDNHLFVPVHYFAPPGTALTVGDPIHPGMGPYSPMVPLQAGTTAPPAQANHVHSPPVSGLLPKLGMGANKPSKYTYTQGGSGFTNGGAGGRIKTATGMIMPAANPPVDSGDNGDLPVSQETDAIIAWKVGTLCVNDAQDGVEIKAATYEAIHTIDGTASCNKGIGHLAPDLKCTCGYYAYRSVAELKKFKVIKQYGTKEEGQVLMQVELRGKVIEHERLMRAEKQLITCVYLPNECFDCDKPAEVVQFVSGTPYIMCKSCSDNESSQSFMAKSPVFTPNSIGQMLGTDVQFFNQGGW